MQRHSVSPNEILMSIWKHKYLVSALVKRDIIGRYHGSTMGLLWSLFNPIIMLSIYTFVFSVVFKARWGTGTGSKTEFALMLFAGLILFNLFAECISRAPTIILANTNYVKKVVFPLELLPIVSLGTALFHFTVSLCVWLAAYTVFFGIPHLQVLAVPLILIPLILFILGISWFIASIGVFLRDVSQVIGVVVSIMMFLSPIFYPISALPEQYRAYLNLNPLTGAIELTRGILFNGDIPAASQLLPYYISALLVCYLGFAWFQMTRKGFADVL